jgi:hypothetical protein
MQSGPLNNKLALYRFIFYERQLNLLFFLGGGKETLALQTARA